MALKLTAAEVVRISPVHSSALNGMDFLQYLPSSSSAGGDGSAMRVLDLDAEQMLEHLGAPRVRRLVVTIDT